MFFNLDSREHDLEKSANMSDIDARLAALQSFLYTRQSNSSRWKINWTKILENYKTTVIDIEFSMLCFILLLFMKKLYRKHKLVTTHAFTEVMISSLKSNTRYFVVTNWCLLIYCFIKPYTSIFIKCVLFLIQYHQILKTKHKLQFKSVNHLVTVYHVNLKKNRDFPYYCNVIVVTLP